ncbi:hypothetical protein HUU05_26675 [candidate division KSB1 bacterium]|nr:hypothetical protein [candidate division KSB1 bacterium]
MISTILHEIRRHAAVFLKDFLHVLVIAAIFCQHEDNLVSLTTTSAPAHLSGFFLAAK